MTNELVVFHGSQLLHQRPLGAQPVEVGSASDCDLPLAHPDVPARAYLVHERLGTVWLHDVSRPGSDPQLFPLDRPVWVGPFCLVRRRAGLLDAPERVTLPVVSPLPPVTEWTLLVGRSNEARRLRVADQPVTVGTARDNDLVLHDPTVSQHHCRFEPGGGRLWVRDLGSTNGTHLQGVRTQRAELSPGVRMRIGRTDLYVLAASSEGPATPGERRVVAVSRAMQEVVAECLQFTRVPWPALLLGPSGCGKEELAHLLHRESPRRDRPFVAINAGGLPRELVESELFGHEKGAFTGAVAARKGAFEQADGGTLFLDEIGELPLDLQARLLRVLETWQVRRVGAEQSFAVDVRLVCATHCDLARMAGEGRFRADLYWRLAQAVVKVPPLCERPDDVLALADHFLERLTADLGQRVLTNEARTRLLAHAWPGNARELRNVLGLAAAMAPGASLELADVEAALRRLSGPRLTPALDDDSVERALALHRGNLSAVSRALSVPRSTLRDRLRRGGDTQSSPRRSMSASSRPK